MKSNRPGFNRARVFAALAVALVAVFPFATAALIAAPAAAYVGPGAGLSAIGTLVALIVALFLAILGFIWYPMRRILGKSKPPGGSSDRARTERRPPTRS